MSLFSSGTLDSQVLFALLSQKENRSATTKRTIIYNFTIIVSNHVKTPTDLHIQWRMFSNFLFIKCILLFQLRYSPWSPLNILLYAVRTIMTLGTFCSFPGIGCEALHIRKGNQWKMEKLRRMKNFGFIILCSFFIC